VTLCVLDASVALSWSFEDETSPYAEEVIEALKTRTAVVPLVWPLEIDNAILAAVRRRRIREADAFRFLTVLDALPLEIDLNVARETLGQRILGLGLTHGLSAYDASYLELAMRRGLPLATQDERLIRAADAAGINVLRP
jgi:predicted nucleic acid-binding protein